MIEFQIIGQKFGRILLAAVTVLAVVLTGWMVVNLYKSARVLDLSASTVIVRNIAKPLSHEKYDGLVAGFRESYTSSNAHKRNIFVKSKGFIETCPASVASPDTDFNDITKRLHVARIYKKPVKLLFKGYIQMGDGAYVATINWGGKTDFKKVGETIRGYKVTDFKKDVSEQKTIWGGSEKVDRSVIALLRDGGEKFNLEIGKVTLEKEIYAEIIDRKESMTYEAYVGCKILGNKVLDILSGEVIIDTPDGKKVTLSKEPEKS